MFIVFEGPEGAGKSTQARLLAARLKGRGYEVLLTREPGGTPVGERIRSLLLDMDGYAMLAATEALLYAAARVQHVGEVIAPALERGETVVCDRFVDSSYAYQGGGHGLSFEELRAVQRLAAAEVRPNLRVLLDLPVTAGLARRHAAGEGLNRLDVADLSFHQRVRATYLDLVRADPKGWCHIDASGSVESVADDVTSAIEQRLGVKLDRTGPRSGTADLVR